MIWLLFLAVVLIVFWLAAQFLGWALGAALHLFWIVALVLLVIWVIQQF